MYGNRREKYNSRYKTEVKENPRNIKTVNNLDKTENPIPQTAQKISHNKKKISSSSSRSNKKEYSLDSVNSSPLQIMTGIEINTDSQATNGQMKREGSTPKFKGKGAALENLTSIKKNLFENGDDTFEQDNEKEKEIDLHTGFSFKNGKEQVPNDSKYNSD